MKKFTYGLLLSTTLLTSCSDNGGNGGGAPGYTHKELAVKFVEELNLNADFEVELIKKSTDQSDFIVIYDPLYDSYDAIDIENYDPSLDNASDYYHLNSASFYYDLDEIPGHYEGRWVGEWVDEYAWDEETGTWYDTGYNTYQETYQDVWIDTKYRDVNSGLYFEKTAASPKDLAKMAAIKEAAAIDKTAQHLSSNFGLSIDRAKEVAKLSSHWKKASKKSMTNSEIDAFSTELLGFSITTGKKAVQESIAGESEDLEALVKKAAEANGITPEHATKLMSKVFGL